MCTNNVRWSVNRKKEKVTRQEHEREGMSPVSLASFIPSVSLDIPALVDKLYLEEQEDQEELVDDTK